MIELWVIRHGQTYDNILKTLAKFDGGKLTELGKKQAIQCGERLKNENFDATYVSDLNRTRETFDGINSVRTDNLKQNMFYTNLLREKWAGDAQGMKYSQFHELSKQDRNFKLNNGECWNDVNKRVYNFIQYIVNTELRGQNISFYSVQAEKTTQDISLVEQNLWHIDYQTQLLNLKPTRVTDTLRKSTRHTKLEKFNYKQQIK